MTISAVYLRLSKDKALGTDDEGLGVERQEAAVRKMLEKRSWTVGPIYRDNDVSASGKAPRPEYDRMLADYAAGEFDAIAAFDHDRLTRRPVELEHLIELNTKQGLLVATVSGDVDFTSPNGILFARFRVNLAADELMRRSSRQKAKFAQDREAGKHHWRGRRPFGLTLEGREVPEEAQALRDIAELLLDGGTVSAGVELLASRGILTTFDKEWQRQPLRKTLMNPRVAGLLEHDGELLPGNWDAVLDRETWDAVVAVLNTPGRAKPKLTEREYLLSGLLTCEECGGRCYGTRARSTTGNRKETYIYRCAKTHVSKAMKQTDTLVILKTLEALLSVPVAEVEADKEALKALREARAVEVKWWADWMEEAVRERLKPSDVRSYREGHEAKLAELDRKIVELEKVSLVRLPTVDELAETSEENGEIVYVFEWDKLSLEKRRRTVESLWQSITLKKTTKGARWSDENVVLVPR